MTTQQLKDLITNYLGPICDQAARMCGGVTTDGPDKARRTPMGELVARVRAAQAGGALPVDNRSSIAAQTYQGLADQDWNTIVNS